MRKTKRLVLSVERLRTLTPSQLGRAVGGEPIDINQSLNNVCDSLYVDCDTLSNLTTDTFTNNTLTITLIETEL